jgi:2-alkenal reductase
MATATVQPGSPLEELVRRYQVCWDVWPEEAMVDGKRRQIGFELELSGTHPPEVKNASPGCDHCQEIFGALLEIAEHILPSKSDRPSKYLIGPYEHSIRYSQKRGSRPDISLTIKIVHRQGLGPVDECEQRCLKVMEERLVALGASEGTWQAHKANQSALGASVLLVLAALWLALTPSATGQTAAMSPDEQQTVNVVRIASASVVHIDAHNVVEAAFEKHSIQTSTGTGFVSDREGRMLTAFHVIKDMNEIDVILANGKRVSVRVVGTAPQLDIALLQPNQPVDDLRPLPFYDSDSLQPGQKVIVIGNALGLHNTVTVGVVSGVGRRLSEVPTEIQDAMIQTDAAVNPGNSGRPLLNSAGQVIGIVDANTPSAQNLGFAIPINFARRIIPDLIAMGHPYRPQLGFSGSEITPAVARLYGLPIDHGFLVEEVLPGSPAALAGLRPGDRIVVLGDAPHVLGGDIIIAANGQPASTPSQLARLLLELNPGDTLRLKVQRRLETVEMVIPLAPMNMQF